VTDAPLRILFVSDAIRATRTGTGRIAETWLRELHALGAEVIPLDREPNPIAERIAGRCEVLPTRGALLRTARWHFDLLRRVPTLGVEHDVLFDPSAYPNVRGEHPRQAVLVHDLSMLQPGLYRRGKRAWFRAFYGRALRRARLKVCVSEHTRRALIERFALPADECVVVPNAIDPAFPTAPARRPRELPDGPFLLAVGAIERRKNVGRLLAAFMATDLPHRLVFVGRPGADVGDLPARLRAASPRVVWLQATDDDELRWCYRNAGALLFPSLEEGFGLPILEAMQSDLPVLTSNVTAMPEVAADAALLVDPRNVEALRDGIVRVATDEALAAELRARGRRRSAQFAPRDHARALLGHLTALARTAAPVATERSRS